MSQSLITLNGNSVTLVALPAAPALRAVQFDLMDAVSIVASPFTGQTQSQSWPGADMWSAQLTLPPMPQATAKLWIAFLMQMRGIANAMQIGDPMGTAPSGSALGAPAADGTIAGGNAPGSTSLNTKGWPVSTNGLLLPGDYLQIGYRLHRVLDQVNSDVNGKAVLNVWPSLRETPPDGELLVLNNPVGLFRLGSNKRTWNSDYTKITRISFPILEYR